MRHLTHHFRFDMKPSREWMEAHRHCAQKINVLYRVIPDEEKPS